MTDVQALRQLGALVARQIAPQDVPLSAWPQITQQALGNGLAPMLLWAARQAAPEIASGSGWMPIIAAARGTAIRHALLEKTQIQVNAALAAAHIPALWLKGFALAHTVYPQPALRPMCDLDVLVPYIHREAALRVVEGLGYHFYETAGHLMSSTEALHLNVTHHYHLRGGVNDSVVLELHFQLLSTDDQLLPLDKLAWFWTQTGMVRNGRTFIALQPEAHLLYLCAHAILQHGEANISLRQYFDLHQIISQTVIDWDKVIAQSAVFGWNYAVHRALAQSQRYFSTPVPDTVMARLQGDPHDAAAVRAVRLQGRGSRGEGTWMTLQHLSRQERMDLVRRILFPPQAYMRHRYGVPPDRRVWPYYVYRWADQSQDVAWALWKRLDRGVRWRGSRH